MRDPDSIIEGRNVVLEALRSGRSIDRIFLQKGLTDGPIETIVREAKKQKIIVDFISKERLEELSPDGHHQGVVAYTAAYSYSTVEDMLSLAESRGEDPFLILLDEVDDPHNIGAIIRTAEVCGAHGVILPERRSPGLSSTVAKASAGALNYLPVAKVTNLSRTMEDLKKKGVWFVCADMDGTPMYDLNLTGPVGLVIGNEGSGVGKLVKKNCDMTASIPMKGKVGSLNASVAAGVLMYEIVRQRIR